MVWDWQRIATHDLREEGEEYMICEMCEVQTIRFVQTMLYPDCPETLDCGCDGAARRQKVTRRKAWKVSAKGNPHIKVDGYRCVVARRSNGYSVGITQPSAERPTWGQQNLLNLEKGTGRML